MNSYIAKDFKKICYLLVALLLFNESSHAAIPNKSAPMQITAGSAEIDQQKHVGIFEKGVSLVQGESHLRAARAITRHNTKNKLIAATCYGDNKSQAHFWSNTAKGKMHAYANIITFYSTENIIELSGNARITQSNDSFSAPLIRYNTTSGKVITEKKNNQRTSIIIHPGKSS